MRILHLLHQPLYQFVFFSLITWLSVPFLKSKSANAVWNVAGLLYIGFVFTNAVFLWFAEHTWNYFFISLAFSVGYILITGTIVSVLVRVLRISGSGESAMIFLFIIYHPFILLSMIFLKWLF